jgi:hypothetical protein
MAQTEARRPQLRLNDAPPISPPSISPLNRQIIRRRRLRSIAPASTIIVFVGFSPALRNSVQHPSTIDWCTMGQDNSLSPEHLAIGNALQRWGRIR